MVKIFMPQKSENDKGFTLMEVLVVLIIIGIISSIAVLGLRAAYKTSRIASCKIDVSSVYSAALAYLLDNPTPVISLTGPYDFTKTTSLNPFYPKYLQPIKDNSTYYKINMQFNATTYAPEVWVENTSSTPTTILNNSNYRSAPEFNCAGL